MGAEEAMELAKAGVSLVGLVARLIESAIAGDTAARKRIQRVEEVLRDSPTDRAWNHALALAAAKGRAETLPPPPANPFDDGSP